MNALDWKRNLHLKGHELRRSTADDAAGLVKLMAEPDVEQWWHQAWETDRWAAYIAGLVQDPDSLPLILADDALGGRTLGYVEVYRVATDILGQHTAHSPADLGMHLALGELARGRGLGARLIRSVLDVAPGILEGCGRLVAEPDTRNTRSHRAFEAAGFAAAGTVQLPDKSALLVVAAPNAVSIQETASIQAAGSLQQAVSPHHTNEGVLL